MLKDFFDSLRESFVQFSLGSLFYVIFVVSMIGLGLYLGDRATGYSEYARVERQITALERLHALEQKGVVNSKTLGPIYSDLVTQLNRTNKAVRTRPVFALEPLIKFVAATFIPLIFAFVALPGALRGDPNNKSALLGSVLVVLMFGVPTFFIPNIMGSVPLTAAMFFAVQLSLVVFITKKYASRNRTAA